jgi:hypothetical protein
MRRRSVALAAALAAGATGAIRARRRSARRETRVDVYFTDGSMVSLPSGSPDADRVLPVARELLSLLRGSG